MNRAIRTLLGVGVTLGLASAAAGQVASVQPVCSGLVGTVQLVSHADPALLYAVVVSGQVRAIELPGGVLRPSPVLDLSSLVDNRGDGGLLSLAFDPAYASNHYAYVYYNVRPDHTAVLSRWTMTPDGLGVVPGSEHVVLRMPRPIGHNAGWIGFSPVDHLLYVSSGDGGTGASPDPENAAQTITNQWRGKILRIDPTGDDFPGDADRNYRVPPGNPFVGVVGDDEIWAYGIRNAWRCSFDTTGELWMGDVGQDLYEEVNVDPGVAPGGRNYGWRCMEGPVCTGLNGCPCPAGLTEPVYAYDHAVGCSITGGFVYRGPSVPSLQGAYIFADWCAGRLFSLRRSPLVVEDITDSISGASGVHNIAGFGTDASGELYMAAFFAGVVYRLGPQQPPSCDADLNQDGNADQDDVAYLINVVGGGANPTGIDPDFNHDGNVDQDDVSALIGVVAGGACP